MKQAFKEALQETLEPILAQLKTEVSVFVTAADARLSVAEATIDTHALSLASLEIRVQSIEDHPIFM